MSTIFIVAWFMVPILWLWSGIWARGDAKRRGKPPLLVGLLALFALWPISLLAWVLFRPEDGKLSRKPFDLQDFR